MCTSTKDDGLKIVKKAVTVKGCVQTIRIKLDKLAGTKPILTMPARRFQTLPADAVSAITQSFAYTEELLSRALQAYVNR